MRHCVILSLGFKIPYDLFRREVFNFVMESDIPTKLIREPDIRLT
jgi:hypothetical protein